MAARKPGKKRKPRMSKGAKDVKALKDQGAKVAFHPVTTGVVDDIDDAIPKSTMGRPPKYDPKFCRIARKMCEMGATDQELAEAFDVDSFTIRRWQVTHTDFCAAVKLGVADCDDRVERSFYQRAVGYSYKATKIMQYEGSPIKVDYVEHVPPDAGAAKNWLANRRREKWTGESTNVNLSGTVKTEGEQSAMDVARWVAFILAKAENEKTGA